MGIAPLELVRAEAWEKPLLTTYSLSLSFFEGVVLDALFRGGSKHPTIMSDIEGVRSALSDQGARRAGRDYEIEPVAVSGGVFHPKLIVLPTKADAHLLVGSGNLTFGGWGGNLEVIEHVHASFAPTAILEAAEFFELLGNSNRIRHGGGATCFEAARALRRSVGGYRSDGAYRFLHTLNRSIFDSLEELCAQIGRARRITVASPFWDGGAALDELCRRLGLDHAYVHSHQAGCVEGRFGTNWPRSALSAICPVNVDVLSTTECVRQRLHAKLIEIICDRGRLLISGSPNATYAALAGKNVETAIARVQRGTLVGWTSSNSEPPELVGDVGEGSQLTEIGVLRAVLNDDKLFGRVLIPKIEGRASVSYITAEGVQLLGDVMFEPSGAFTLIAPDFELVALDMQRLILRVQQGELAAEGFVSISLFGELSKRAGAIASRLFSILAGTETPADVAAVMAWFHENPDRVSTLNAIAGGSEGPRHSSESEDPIDPDLLESSVPLIAYDAESEPTSSSASWIRFMNNLFAALRVPRGPLDSPETEDHPDGGDPETRERTTKTAAERELCLKTFENLLRLLLETRKAAHLTAAFDLCQYVANRMKPDQEAIENWIEDLLDEAANIPVGDRMPDFASAALALCVSHGETPSACRAARRRLRQIGYDVDGEKPDVSRIKSLTDALTLDFSADLVWANVKTCRTFEEQAAAYLKALDGDKAVQPYTEFIALPEYGEVLRAALSSTRQHQIVLRTIDSSGSCPKCYRALPLAEKHNFKTYSVGKALNCCGRLIVLDERSQHGAA